MRRRWAEGKRRVQAADVADIRVWGVILGGPGIAANPQTKSFW